MTAMVRSVPDQPVDGEERQLWCYVPFPCFLEGGAGLLAGEYLELLL